jgi:hypothetical protein
MSALVADRNTPQRTGERRNFPVAAGVILRAGAMVAVNSTGFAVPVTTALNLKGVGRSEAFVDNTLGAAGDLLAEVGSGIFRFDNSTVADLLTQADIGSDCYGVDDHTVAKTAATNTRSVVGKVFDVDANGVWVKFL